MSFKKLKSHTVIEDPCLEPYFITRDDHCFTVNIRVKTNQNHFKSNGKNKEYSKSLTFHPNFQQALKRISQEQLHTKKHYKTLTQFMSEFKNIENNIKNYIYEQ